MRTITTTVTATLTITTDSDHPDNEIIEDVVSQSLFDTDWKQDESEDHTPAWREYRVAWSGVPK